MCLEVDNEIKSSKNYHHMVMCALLMNYNEALLLSCILIFRKIKCIIGKENSTEETLKSTF